MTPAPKKNGAPQEDELARAAEKAFRSPFGAVLQLAPKTGAALWVDGRSEIPAVLTEAPKRTPENEAALCTWQGQRESLVRALSGERGFESAFVSGRIAISGDISVMARLKIEGGR